MIDGQPKPMTEQEMRSAIFAVQVAAGDRLLDAQSGEVIQKESHNGQEDTTCVLSTPGARLSIRSVHLAEFSLIEVLSRKWNRTYPDSPDWIADVEHYVHFWHKRLSGQFVRKGTHQEKFSEDGYTRGENPIGYTPRYELRAPEARNTVSAHKRAATDIPRILEQLQAATLDTPTSYDLPIESYKVFKPNEFGIYQILESDLK